MSKSGKFFSFAISIFFVINMIFACIFLPLTNCSSIYDQSNAHELFSFSANFEDEFVEGKNLSLESELLISDNSQMESALGPANFKYLSKLVKKEFKSKYDLSQLFSYKIFETNADLSKSRLDDFSKLQSISIKVGISEGEIYDDSFCAIMVRMNTLELEQAVLAGDYSLIKSGNMSYSLETVKILQAEEENKRILNINASGDGFLFLLSLAGSGVNVGMIVLIVGIIVSIVLVGLLIYVIRSYQLEKRRKKFTTKVKEFNKLAGVEGIENKNLDKKPTNENDILIKRMNRKLSRKDVNNNTNSEIVKNNIIRQKELAKNSTSSSAKNSTNLQSKNINDLKSNSLVPHIPKRPLPTIPKKNLPKDN